MSFVFANQMVTDFHAAQAARAISHERHVLKMAEQNPEGLAALVQANPKLLNSLSDPEAIAMALAETGYSSLCDSIAYSEQVNRDVRAAFRARGLVDYF